MIQAPAAALQVLVLQSVATLVMPAQALEDAVAQTLSHLTSVQGKFKITVLNLQAAQ